MTAEDQTTPNRVSGDTKNDGNFSRNPHIRWLATCGRFFLNVVDLRAFYSTAMAAIEKQTNGIRAEYQKEADEAVTDQKFETMFEDSPVQQSAKMLREFSDALAQRSIRTAKQTVDSASLVFAHSILDGVLTDCCWISFYAKPSDWFRLIENCNVDVSSVLKGQSKLRVQQLAMKRVGRLDRESMVKRLACLHRVCGPKMKGRKMPTAWLNADRLDAFDRTRQRTVHGRSFSQKLPDVLDQIAFAHQAGFSALALVQESYHLLRKEAFTSMSGFSGLRICASIRREFPEFWEIMQRHVEQDSANGSTGQDDNAVKPSSVSS